MQPCPTFPPAAEPPKANLELTLGGNGCSPSKSSARLTLPSLPAGFFFFLSLEAKLTFCSCGLLESTFTTFSSFTTFSCLFTSPNEICPAVLVTITRKTRRCNDRAMVVVVVAVGVVVLPGCAWQESVCGAGSPLAAGKPNHPGEAAVETSARALHASNYIASQIPLYCFPLYCFPSYCCSSHILH